MGKIMELKKVLIKFFAKRGKSINMLVTLLIGLSGYEEIDLFKTSP